MIGVVVGSAGASGGGAQTLYLVDTQSGKFLTIATADQNEPEWFVTSDGFGYKEAITSKTPDGDFEVSRYDEYIFVSKDF